MTALLVSPFAHALVPTGRAAADEGAAAEALAPGSWSVQFSVQPNFTLGSYSGSTLSLKRHLASGNALRFGVSLDLDTRSGDFVDVAADTLSTITQAAAFDGNLWSIGVSTYYLWYGRRAAPLHAYGGVGPTASWSRGRDEQLETRTIASLGQPPVTYTALSDVRRRGWRVGIAAAAGVEWLVARRVGLFAEYGSSLAYSGAKDTRRFTLTATGQPPRTIDSDRDAHGWSFSGSGGRLGVSAYY